MMDIHGYPCIYQVYPPRWIYMVHPWINMDIPGISMRTAYTWDIPGIFHIYIHEIGVPDGGHTSQPEAGTLRSGYYDIILVVLL